ncbi:GAF domain-containing protein [Kineococcus rubinsiae]|uniref:GAF domain-containing protein n=1 Tax=Kineococcus rubinsiae TaxID=2609562 RepID=UPI0014306A27|nr:GAF domain-containing protein [Kineococcus rubinsiae]NIZ90117.1 GAF domain-containing protein [Kineococcus rubinsiae]
MPAAPEHRDERRRLASLEELDARATSADVELRALATEAARALGMPAAMISMVGGDRQWFAARRGLTGVLGYDAPQTPRDVSFCAHVVAAEAPIAVPDATADERFADNALVTGPEHLRAYAGAPVFDRDGLPLGALCVLDRHPRDLDATALAVLSELAASVGEVLDRHRPAAPPA